MGACVTAAARSPGDLARAVVMGASNPLELRRISTQVEFDIIFNTVPALVLDRSHLRHLSPETVIIDIASSPGGTDFEAAQQQGIKGNSRLVAARQGCARYRWTDTGSANSSPARKPCGGGEP